MPGASADITLLYVTGVYICRGCELSAVLSCIRGLSFLCALKEGTRVQRLSLQTTAQESQADISLRQGLSSRAELEQG